ISPAHITLRSEVKHEASFHSLSDLGRPCPLWVDTVEKVVSDPPKRNNRIRTARYLNRNCVRGRDFESMLRIQGRKIVFQQYRSKADIRAAKGMSALPPKADMCGATRDVRFGPKADMLSHSITSLALARSDCGTVRPNAFAVLRLITSSYLVGACTGRLAGFSPLRMRSTYSAA